MHNDHTNRDYRHTLLDAIVHQQLRDQSRLAPGHVHK